MNYTGLNQWAARWNIPAEAMRDLVAGVTSKPGEFQGKSESCVQANIMLKASAAGARLFRNNSGAHTTDDGRHVRFGLGNVSVRVNKTFKSPDLVGLEPVKITPFMVGSTIGRFLAIEVKEGSWKPGKTDRELAQANFIRVVNRLGGRAYFSNGEYLS